VVKVVVELRLRRKLWATTATPGTRPPGHIWTQGIVQASPMVKSAYPYCES